MKNINKPRERWWLISSSSPVTGKNYGSVIVDGNNQIEACLKAENSGLIHINEAIFTEITSNIDLISEHYRNRFLNEHESFVYNNILWAIEDGSE